MTEPQVRLTALEAINRLVFTRDELLGKLADLNADKFSITINGRDGEDCEFKRRAKVEMKRIVRDRIASIEHDLGEYGVDVLS